MSISKFSDVFKHDAVHQITKRGYSVADVFQASTHSDHKCLSQQQPRRYYWHG